MNLQYSIFNVNSANKLHRRNQKRSGGDDLKRSRGDAIMK